MLKQVHAEFLAKPTCRSNERPFQAIIFSVHHFLRIFPKLFLPLNRVIPFSNSFAFIQRPLIFSDRSLCTFRFDVEEVDCIVCKKTCFMSSRNFCVSGLNKSCTILKRKKSVAQTMVAWLFNWKNQYHRQRLHGFQTWTTLMRFESRRYKASGQTNWLPYITFSFLTFIRLFLLFCWTHCIESSSQTCQDITTMETFKL